MFNGKLQIELLSLDDIVASHVMDASSKYSPPVPARSKNPQELRGVSSGSWIGIFGPPKCIQTEEWAKRRNGVRANSCSGRRIKFLFQGRARACGYLDAGMVWLEESIIAFLQMIELGGTNPLGG